MKKNVIRIAALAVLLVMTAALFTACAQKDEKVILGKWQTVVDFGSVAVDEMDELKEQFGDFDLSGITMTMFLEFSEDGTYNLSLEKESAEKAMKEMVERMKPAFENMLKSLIAEMSGVDVSAVTDEQINAMLTLMEVGSMDEFVNSMTEDMDTEEMLKDANKSGKYLLKDGKLYMSDSVDKEPADGDLVKYELTPKQLKLDAENKDDVPEELSALLPLVFTQVK